MFTINNLRAATVTTFAVAILAVPAFSAPKRDVGNGKHQPAETFEVRLIHPATPPSGGGHHDITIGAMAKRDTSIAPEPGSSTQVRLVSPSPFPTGTGSNDVTVGAMRKKDNDNGSKKSADQTVVRLVSPSPFPTGTGSNDVTMGAMTTGAGSEASGVAATKSASASFIRSLDLSSGGRWTGGASAPIVTRNAFTDGRAWVSLTKDANDGIVATAGMSFLLK